MFEISNGPTRAAVSGRGGALVAVGVAGRALVDGAARSEDGPPCAGWLLAPWPNRIGDGVYTFDGQTYELPINEPARRTALHGLVWGLPCKLVERGPSFVVLRCELPASGGYPWPLTLTTRWEATQRGIHASHEAVNAGERRAPFGFGVHPYLFVPGVPIDDLALELRAGTRLETDERLLPVAEVPAEPHRFDPPRRIGAVELDTAFGSVPPGPITASVRAPDGRGVEIRADAGFRWWQVYTSHTLPAPFYRRSVAVEPNTSPPDAFRTGRDVIVLEPGETWRGTWEIDAI